ncbi:hypothetical protein M422DRAFT_26559 [Sphaerobolus stellatus SS14]|nr:hypothetical protein M422DRAFT_26559 [Sphaerobolus stellatus SS14]
MQVLMLPIVVRVLVVLAIGLGFVVAQTVPGSSPKVYPGIPNTSGNFSDSTAWQNYFKVDQALPNVTFPLPRHYAGNLPVNRQGHPNNTLFFWGFENSVGSLTTRSSNKPWVIWLNGGPGTSSLVGLFMENGPIHFHDDGSPYRNQYGWDYAVDIFYLDQPVGVGFSTADADGYVNDEEQVGADFMGFVSNLVQVFPSLKTRPLYLIGESYAGIYIPYITKAYLAMSNPPVSLKKIVTGNAAYADDEIDIYPPVPLVLETYPQIIGYDPTVLEYFKEQAHLCEQDLNLTYPQTNPLPHPPTVTFPFLGSELRQYRFESREIALKVALKSANKAVELSKRMGAKAPRSLAANSPAEVWRRGLDGRAKGTIDPWYGCDTYDEMVDYALNFSAPWVQGGEFDNIPDALSPEAPTSDTNSFADWLNDPRTVAALHAPTARPWFSMYQPGGRYPFGSGPNDEICQLIIVSRPSTFMSDLMAKMAKRNVTWTMYNGDADSLLPPHGTQIVIQNTTFGGIQGFTQRPATPWWDYLGNMAGKVHQERGLTYAVFFGAGHLLPQTKPVAALAFLQEWILGDSIIGLVLPDGSVYGGTNPTLAQSVFPQATAPIFYGSGSTQGSTVFPSKTIAAWSKYIATAIPTQPIKGNLKN